MNLQSLSKQIIEDALERGIITLGSGKEIELNATQILATAKYVLKEGIVTELDSISSTNSSAPSEMFIAKKLELDDKVTLNSIWPNCGCRSKCSTCYLLEANSIPAKADLLTLDLDRET